MSLARNVQNDSHEAATTDERPKAPPPKMWLLQIRRGELRLIKETSELVRLIRERRVERHALLYPISGDPEFIGTLPELAPLFESQSQTSAAVAGSDSVDLERSFASEEVPYLDSISPLGATDQAFGDEYEVPVTRRGPLFAILLVLLMAGGAGYLWWQRVQTPAPVATVPAPAPVAATPPPPAPVETPPPPPAVVEEPAPPPAAVLEKPAPAPAAVVEKPAPAPAAVAEKPASAPAAVAEKPAPAAPKPAVRESYEKLVADGDRLIEAGKTRRAMALFERAAQLRPDGAAALAGQAYGWLDQGDAKRAISLFQRALQHDPQHAQALFGLGEAYREQGRRGEALDAFRRYLARFPGHREASAARRQIAQLSGAP